MASQPHYVAIQYPVSGGYQPGQYTTQQFQDAPIRTSYVKIVQANPGVVYPASRSITSHQHLTSSISSLPMNLPVANSITYPNEQDTLTEFRYIEYVPIEHRILAPANTTPEMLPYYKNQQTIINEKPVEYEYIQPYSEFIPKFQPQANPSHVYMPKKAEYVQPQQYQVQQLPNGVLRGSGVYAHPQVVQQPLPISHQAYPHEYPTHYPHHYAHQPHHYHQNSPPSYHRQEEYRPNHPHYGVEEAKKSGYTSEAHVIGQATPERRYRDYGSPKIQELPNGIQTSHHNEPKIVVQPPPQKSNPTHHPQPQNKFEERRIGGQERSNLGGKRATRGDYASLE